MTATAANALNTPNVRADTGHMHPHSPDARGRALLHAAVAKNSIIAATHHRREGRASWARSCLTLAAVSRRHAAYEFRNARGA